MVKTLFFDTETTDKWKFNLPADDPAQPSIVQFAGILVGDDGIVRSLVNILVQPNGWKIAPGAAAVHGITEEDANEFGVSISNAAHLIRDLFVSADVAVAHNADFDQRIVNRALAQAEVSEIPWDRLILRCTMLGSMNILKLPGKFGKQFKWPSLAEAHGHLLGTGFDGAHDALADTRACRAVYDKLIELGVWSNAA